MARSKKRTARDLADERIRDLIPAGASAEQVLEDQHRLLEAYKRGQTHTSWGDVPNLGWRDPHEHPLHPLTPPGAPVSPSEKEAALSRARVDDWMREVLLPKAQRLAPGADEQRLARLMLADRTIGPWLKDRAEGKDSPGEAAIEGAIVQMLKRASIATSQNEDDDGE